MHAIPHSHNFIQELKTETLPKNKYLKYRITAIINVFEVLIFWQASQNFPRINYLLIL
jgi:thiaminase